MKNNVIYRRDDNINTANRVKKVFVRWAALSFCMMLLFTCIDFPGMNDTVQVLAAAKVTISSKKKTLTVGSKTTLKLNNAKGTVTWASSNSKVAKVTSKGKVSALKPGTATITAICGGKSYTCKVTVKAAKLSSEEVYAKICNSVVEIDAGESLGSGFFITKNTIATNYHVIDGASKLVVKLHNQEEYNVETVVAYSADLDLAILKVGCEAVPLSRNTHGVTTGETTFTLGSSLGLTDTFANGMVSNPHREMDGVNYIQTNAAISPGNSGGPLINSYGEVMGINTCTFVDGQNLNLAIEITELDRLDTSNPVSAKDFIESFKQSAPSGTTANKKLKPDIEAYFVYDENQRDDVCGLLIANNGTKNLVVGGRDGLGTTFIYPGDNASNYAEGYYMDLDATRKISSFLVKPGTNGGAIIILDRALYLQKDAIVVFCFVYDGVTYLGACNADGEFEYELLD